MAIYNESAMSAVTLNENAYCSGPYRDTLADTFDLADVSWQGLLYSRLIADSFNAADVATWAFARTLADGISLGDTIRALNSTPRIADTFMLLEEARAHWTAVVADTLDIADTLATSTTILIQEALSLIDSNLVGGVQSVSVLDAIVLIDLDSYHMTWTGTAADTFDLADAPSSVHNKNHTVQDFISVIDFLSDTGSFNHTIDDLVTLVDSVIRAWGLGISDSFNMADSLIEGKLTINALILEAGLTVTDVVEVPVSGNVKVSDSVQFQTTLSTILTANEIIQETLSVGAKIVLGGEVWQAWALTGKDLQISSYSNYGFTSFATIAGKDYGCKSSGIYRLDGTTDDGADIHTGVRFVTDAIGTQQKKRFRTAYFGLTGDRPALRVTTEEGMIRYYLVKDRRAIIGRDVWGKEWTFDLADADELNFVELVPVILTRG